MHTRVGSLSLQVPQVRDSEFYPQSLERGLRSERALKLVVAEMYVQGVSVALSEHEVHGRHFLQSLTARGLHGVQLIISDAHAGLKAARQAVFPSIPWQRCQFHLQQNAQAHVPKQSLKAAVASELRAVLTAPNRIEAQRLLQGMVTHYQREAPRLSQWLETNVTEGLTVFDYPEAHRRRLRTTNRVERVNKEIKRRTRVAALFPNTASCERLVTAVLMEVHEDWQAGKIYLTI